MTIEAVLDLVDNAPAFVDVDPATLAQAERKFGLEQLNAGLAQIRAAEGDDRAPMLSAIAEQLGQLVAAGAIEDTFAKESLILVAGAAGLIRDMGAKAVKGAIAAGLKLGRKSPRDLTEVRRAASAALGAPHMDGRPREAGDNVISFPADRPDSAFLSSTSSFASSSPRTPSGEEEEQDETLANHDDDDQGPPGDEISDQTFRDCAELDQSDVDNGKRLIAYFGRDLMVRQEDDVAAGQMLAWTGTHWDLAGGEALAHLIGQRVGDLIKLEAAYIEFSNSEARAVNAAEAAAKELKDLVPDTPEQFARVEELGAIVAAGKTARTALSTRRANRKKWGIATKNAGRIAAMIKCAAPHLRRHPDAFNADPLKVATLTHTLSFVPKLDPENPDPDGKRPLIVDGRVQYEMIAKPGHDREDLLTAVIPYAYKKGATAREFNVFLDLFQPEAEKRRTVQQYSGMSLTAQPVQRVMFHTGTGGNGKSVYLEVLARVFGDGLSVGVPAETVSGQVQNNPSAPTPDIARCYAKRYLRIAELPKDAPLKMETIKKLTGGERWPVRTMYKGYFEFKPGQAPHERQRRAEV